MRKVLLAGLAALFVPTVSHAQFELGLRVGYAPALGDAFKDPQTNQTAKLSDGIKSQVPIQIDASYKFDKDWAAGLYVSYGFGQVGQAATCTPDVCSKSANDLRLGAQGFYTFSKVGGPFLPWVGLGLGWERAYAALSADGATLSDTLSGFEAILQVGGDYKLAEQFSIGPYVTYSLGQYTSMSVNISGAPTGNGTTNLSIDRTFHSWFSFGVIGKWDI
jgi:hypothetical protein